MSNLRIAYIINDAAFFVSHRLPIAIEVLKQGGKVCIITGQNINTKIDSFIKQLKSSEQEITELDLSVKELNILISLILN